jgi:hypothetical protein
VTICNNLNMYIAVLTAIVEGMSGGQQASEASYALGAGGGTKQDSKDEQAFSEMLKGAGDKEGVRMPPVPPHTGTWLRVLNRASGVYLYVHTETQRVVCFSPWSLDAFANCHCFQVSSKPIDYVPPASAADAKSPPKEEFEGHRCDYARMQRLGSITQCCALLVPAQVVPVIRLAQWRECSFERRPHAAAALSRHGVRRAQGPHITRPISTHAGRQASITLRPADQGATPHPSI